MSDLVERLRFPMMRHVHIGKGEAGVFHLDSASVRKDMNEAADEIERLRELAMKSNFMEGYEEGFTAGKVFENKSILDDLREWLKEGDNNWLEGVQVVDAYEKERGKGYEATFGTPPPPSLKGY